jgi:hypothetical protein
LEARAGGDIRKIPKKLFYDTAKAAAERLGTGSVSACSLEVYRALTARVPYTMRSQTDARYKDKAILANDMSLPNFCSVNVPLRRQEARIEETACGYVLVASILSQKAGYKKCSLQWRLNMRKFSAGHRALMARIVRAEDERRKEVRPKGSAKREGKAWELCDSRIIHDNGRWFYLLNYRLPKPRDLPRENVLKLYPAKPEVYRPFEIMMPDGKRWGLGDGYVYDIVCKRVNVRRRTVQFRYGRGHGKGHGRQRVYRAIRPIARAVLDMQLQLRRMVASDVVRWCQRTNCGTVIYYEPSKPARLVSWFAKRDLHFGWAAFRSQLVQRLEREGVAVEVVVLKRAELAPDDHKQSAGEKREEKAVKV